MVLTDSVINAQNQIIGAFLHIDDVTYLHKVLKAFELVAEATDTDTATKQLLDATAILGHPRGWEARCEISLKMAV